MPLVRTFPFKRPFVIGVLHLPALPGSPNANEPIERITERATEEARILVETGFDGVIIENFGDAPFFAERVPPHTIAGMTVVARAVRQAVDVPVGINVLRNDACAALAIAHATDSSFVRINVLSGVYATDQGMIEGRAAEVLRFRRRIGSSAAIFADIHVKHATPISQPDVILAAEETAGRGGADALILTGSTTGRPADFEQVRRVRDAVPGHPILIGSGITPDSIAAALQGADGVIVGTALKIDGEITNRIDPERAKTLVSRVRS